MNRRELLQSLTGIGAAAGISAEPSIIDAEPPPLLAVMHVRERLSEEAIGCIRESWERLWIGPKKMPCKLCIIQDGMRLDFVREGQP